MVASLPLSTLAARQVGLGTASQDDLPSSIQSSKEAPLFVHCAIGEDLEGEEEVENEIQAVSCTIHRCNDRTP